MNNQRIAVMQVIILMIGILATTFMIGEVNGAKIPKSADTNKDNQLSGQEIINYYYRLNDGDAKRAWAAADKDGFKLDEYAKNSQTKSKIYIKLRSAEKPSSPIAVNPSRNNLIMKKAEKDRETWLKDLEKEFGDTSSQNKGIELTPEQIKELEKDSKGLIQKNGNYFYNGKQIDVESIAALREAGIIRPDNTLAEQTSHFGFEMTRGTYSEAIFSGFSHATVVYMGIKMIGPLLGMDKGTADAVSKAGFWGIFVGRGMNSLLGKGGEFSSAFQESWLGKKFSAKQVSFGVGAGIALYIYMKNNKEETTEIVTYTCEPWDAPVGGSNCEKCNNQGILPCSEYQCRSLGQACKLLNPDTEESTCAWVNRKDVNPPVIEPLEDSLMEDYKYTPDGTISPPDRGVKIQHVQSQDKCVKAFTPLSFGIKTDEPAKCKLDYERKKNLESMEFYFGGSSTFKYEHTQVLSLPGPNSEGNVTIQNNGDYELYARCVDANGNENTANFVFKFCVEEGPDTTPPLIVTTSLLNNMPIAYNKSSIDLEVYVNEPANCKWSHIDKNYDDMEEQMICTSSALEMNAQMLYKCTTTLTELKDSFNNKFYFRCEDQPTKPKEDRNVNAKSQPEDGFTLIGTQPLVINSVKPNGTTIRDSAESINVIFEAETFAGYDEGKSACYFSETENDDDYAMFWGDEGFDNYKHLQEGLWFPEGSYTYYIKCVDLGGNTDKETITFDVESDSEPPVVVRAYHDDDYLKIITNEESECVYDTHNCNYLFDDGLSMSSASEGLTHFTNWDTTINFYIKCRDEYKNQPHPDECNIIVRPLDI